jgi:hypothetical protein
MLLVCGGLNIFLLSLIQLLFDFQNMKGSLGKKSECFFYFKLCVKALYSR